MYQGFKSLHLSGILQIQHVLLDEKQKKFHFCAIWTGLFCVCGEICDLFTNVLSRPRPDDQWHSPQLLSVKNDISHIYSCIISAGHVAGTDKTPERHTFFFFFFLKQGRPESGPKGNRLQPHPKASQ